MTFNPKDHLINLQGKDYLPVAWRIVWLRDEHPDWRIETELISHEPVLMKAYIKDDTMQILSSGYGTAKTRGVAASRPYEGAETAAIGRALAHAGYGTQFTGEEEGDNLADSPVDNDEHLSEISYETAITVETSKGDKYVELDKKALGGVLRGINRALLKEIDDERRNELLFKKSAAMCILNHE